MTSPKVRAVVSWLENAFSGVGLDLQIERIPASGYGEHLIVRAFPGEAKPVLLLGHTDTVHPVGAKERNPTRIDGDKFFGCGIFDMKSGIILMLEALRYFAETERQPARPITILLSCDEEVGSYTGKPLSNRKRKRRISVSCSSPRQTAR